MALPALVQNLPTVWRHHLVTKFVTNSSYRSNAWVRCASGNVFRENHYFGPFWASFIHGWKATDLLFQMVKTKKIFFASCEASDFWWRSRTDFLHDLRLRLNKIASPKAMLNFTEFVRDWRFWDHPSSRGGELVAWLKKLFSDATMIWEKYKSQLLQPEIALFANSSSDWANSLLPNFHIQISDWKRSDPRKFEGSR